jgi:hypothetical protein
MDTPSKIRWLKRLGKLFPMWALKLQAIVIEHAFDSDLAKAENDWEARNQILAMREFEASEYWGALADIRSHHLANKARKMGVLPSGIKWHMDQYSNHFLDDETQSSLQRTIRDERRKDWDFYFKVVSIVVGTVTGLVGALIGLLAFVTKNR